MDFALYIGGNTEEISDRWALRLLLNGFLFPILAMN